MYVFNLQYRAYSTHCHSIPQYAPAIIGASTLEPHPSLQLEKAKTPLRSDPSLSPKGVRQLVVHVSGVRVKLNENRLSFKFM